MAVAENKGGRALLRTRSGRARSPAGLPRGSREIYGRVPRGSPARMRAWRIAPQGRAPTYHPNAERAPLGAGVMEGCNPDTMPRGTQTGTGETPTYRAGGTDEPENTSACSSVKTYNADGSPRRQKPDNDGR